MGIGCAKACSYILLLLLPLLLHPTAGLGASHGLDADDRRQAASASSPLIEQPVSPSTTSSCISDNMSRHEQDGDEARQIAQYLPYFPFKGVLLFRKRDALIESSRLS